MRFCRLHWIQPLLLYQHRVWRELHHNHPLTRLEMYFNALYFVWHCNSFHYRLLWIWWWEVKIETRPLHSSGWVGCLGLALPPKAIARCKRWRSAIKTRIRFAINSSLDEDCNHINTNHKQTIMPIRDKLRLDLNLWPENTSGERELKSILCIYHSFKR